MVKLITFSVFKLKVLIYGIPNNVYIKYFYKFTKILKSCKEFYTNI